MLIARTKQNLEKILKPIRETQKTIGFVPTMGALHNGHLSLIDLAHKKSDIVITSIFVNPTQFAPHEDLDSYPRHEQQDAKKLEEAQVDILFLPQQSDIYPNGTHNEITVGCAAKGLETDFRPHFFDGVVNVVSRLFDIVRPDSAVFGEKDYQQLMVIREMVQNHNMNIDIIGGTIIRDEHGLALSSRNAYLSDEDLEIARKLNHIIRRDISCDSMKDALLHIGFDKIDYIEKRWNRVLAAAWIGKTRLIDNVSTLSLE